MARLFTRASSMYLEIDKAAVLGNPMTFACWFNSSDAGNDQGLMFIGNKGAAFDRWYIQLSGGNIVAQETGASGGKTATSAAGYNINTWHHTVGVFAGGAERYCYLDGGNKGTNTDDAGAHGTIDRTSIARLGDSTPGNYMDGSMAEIGIWDVALTDDDVLILSKGFSPRFVRPQSLVLYVPLIRDADNDLVGGLSFVAVNTPLVSDHPRIINPR